MKFLFICGREIDYTRNQVLLRAFRRIGEVDTVVETGPAKSLSMRSARIAIRALPKSIFKRYDLVFIGFYGHLLMVTVGLFGNRPKLFDAFVSTYDSLTSDRLTAKPSSLTGRLALLLDQAACRIASNILVDTPAHENYFSSVLGVPYPKLSSIPVSCNEDIFYPRPDRPPASPALVLFYSTYLPIHGVGTILQAADVLRDEPVRFRLIGDGPGFPAARRFCEDNHLENITFAPPLSLTDLSDEIAKADICLGGHFGTSDKAARVVPGKIYQMMAMAKAVIAADSLANRDLLEHNISAYLCLPGNPSALAEAITTLSRDFYQCKNLGNNARNVYEAKCSEAVVTGRLSALISEMLCKN